jgi:hypothetical protein
MKENASPSVRLPSANLLASVIFESGFNRIAARRPPQNAGDSKNTRDGTHVSIPVAGTAICMSRDEPVQTVAAGISTAE